MLHTAGTAVSSATSSSSRAVPGANSIPPYSTPRRGAIVTSRSPTLACSAQTEPGPGSPSAGCRTRSTTTRVSAPAPRTARTV